MENLAPRVEKEGGIDRQEQSNSIIDGRVPPNIGFGNTEK